MHGRSQTYALDRHLGKWRLDRPVRMYVAFPKRTGGRMCLLISIVRSPPSFCQEMTRKHFICSGVENFHLEKVPHSLLVLPTLQAGCGAEPSSCYY